jgi:hypothetical protein
MTGTDKLICQAAALLVLFALTLTPAKAQFGGGGGGQDMMTQMAPMLEMMKKKMGKKRFGALMQTMGPMMSRMTENGGGGFGGLGGLMGGGIPSFGGGGYVPEGYGVSTGGFNIGGIGGGELMSMVPQLVSIANIGGGRHGRRHRKR